MAWIKAGSTTLTVAGDNIPVTPTNSVFYQVLFHTINSNTNTIDHSWRLSSDADPDYSQRRSIDGGADATLINQTDIEAGTNHVSPSFGVGYWCNIATDEKLFMGMEVSQNTAGAGNSPNRWEGVGKYVSGNNIISKFDLRDNQSGSYDTDSNVSVLGSDGVASNVQDGAVYYETDTNKSYVLYNNTWTEL